MQSANKTMLEQTELERTLSRATLTSDTNPNIAGPLNPQKVRKPHKINQHVQSLMKFQKYTHAKALLSVT